MPKAFVSHIEEEAPLASVIKKWAESSFLRLFEVFVSSVPGDITAGHQWFQSLEEELNNSKVMLVICSPASVHRLWINFEAGAGWIKGIPVIPICHSGMTIAALPMPLVFFQAMNAEGEDFASELMASLAKHFGHEKPPVSQEMIADIKDALLLMRQRKGTTEVENGSEGILDIQVLIEEGAEELTEVLAELGIFANELTTELIMFGEDAEKSNSASAAGSPRVRQRLARQFGSKISHHVNKLTELNERYGEALPKVAHNLERLFDYPTLEEEDTESVDSLYSIFEQNDAAIEQLTDVVVNARESFDAMPNVQRDLTRGIAHLSQQLSILIGHLDNTHEMFRRGKATLEALRLRK